MNAQARAGIEIQGGILRYAEVEQYGTRYRLLRLGSCDFEFDLADELLKGAHSDHLGVIREAIEDVFAGTVAGDLRVAVHPPNGYAFFTPLPTGMSQAQRQERLENEAGLLTLPDTGRSAPCRLTADAAYTEAIGDGAYVDWFHVLAVEERVYQRFDNILRVLPRLSYRFMHSMQGAALALHRLGQRGTLIYDADAPFTLLIGWYPSHIEYTLCYQHEWYFSHYNAAAPPDDTAYFAMALLQQLKLLPNVVGEIYLYGEDLDLGGFGVLQKLFKVEPVLLNPIPVVDMDPSSLAASFPVESYVPCLGVAL